MCRELVLVLGIGIAVSACNKEEDCPLGTEGCQCTTGGACDPGLKCLSGHCVNPSSSSDGQAGQDGQAKKPLGAECQSDAECESGNCKEETVEGITTKKCAEPKPDAGTQEGGTPTGTCKIGTKTVESGHYGCDGKKLYKCSSGSSSLKKDCGGCYYIGPGTGYKYKTNCKYYLVSEIPPSWRQEQKDGYKGPGCYYAYDVICGPY